jgi:hypothetical protein
MNFLQKIIHKLNNYDSIVLENNSLRNNNLDFKTENKLLVEQLALEIVEKENIDNKYELLKEEVNRLTRIEELDINKLRNYYESKRSSNPWTYNGGRLGDVDVKYYLKVQTKDEELMFSAADEIIKKYGLQEYCDAEKVADALIRYFKPKSSWNYITDDDKYKRREYWEYAPTSWKERTGDCDDLSILMNALYNFMCKRLKIPEQAWRLTFTAGMVVGEGGHAFNTFLAKDGNYYAVESTYDLKGSYDKTWLKTPIKNNNLYAKFYGFATSIKSWYSASLDKYDGS